MRCVRGGGAASFRRRRARLRRSPPGARTRPPASAERLHEHGHDDPAGVAGEPDQRRAALSSALGQLEQHGQRAEQHDAERDHDEPRGVRGERQREAARGGDRSPRCAGTRAPRAGRAAGDRSAELATPATTIVNSSQPAVVLAHARRLEQRLQPGRERDEDAEAEEATVASAGSRRQTPRERRRTAHGERAGRDRGGERDGRGDAPPRSRRTPQERRDLQRGRERQRHAVPAKIPADPIAIALALVRRRGRDLATALRISGCGDRDQDLAEQRGRVRVAQADGAAERGQPGARAAARAERAVAARCPAGSARRT